MSKEDAEFIVNLKDQASIVINCAERYKLVKDKEDKQEWSLKLYQAEDKFQQMLIDMEKE